MITQAKQTSDSNWVQLTFDDGTTAQVSVTDDIRRQYTDAYNDFIANGGVLEPEFTQAEIDAQTEVQRIEDIDTEMHNRILAEFGANESNYIIKQMNALMLGTVLNTKASLTPTEQAQKDALLIVASNVANIRTKGNLAQTNGIKLTDIVW